MSAAKDLADRIRNLYENFSADEAESKSISFIEEQILESHQDAYMSCFKDLQIAMKHAYKIHLQSYEDKNRQ